MRGAEDDASSRSSGKTSRVRKLNGLRTPDSAQQFSRMNAHQRGSHARRDCTKVEVELKGQALTRSVARLDVLPTGCLSLQPRSDFVLVLPAGNLEAFLHDM